MAKWRLIATLLVLLLLPTTGLSGDGDTSWMVKAKYGVFMHYQHRILLGYSCGTAALV